MRKIVSFAHVTLDGFASATTPGMHSLGFVNISEELFNHVEQRIGKTDTALYGRVTYDMMEAYWPTAADQPNASAHDHAHSRWYKSARKVVLSKSMAGSSKPNTHIISNNVAEEIGKLKQGEGSEILLFGSPSATHALMAENLIDEYWLFQNPVLLGQGIPLFRNIQGKTALKLKDSKTFSSGVVCLSYEVKRD